MNTINVYGGSALSVTLVSNDFIDNHMTGANDAQLKTYLRLIRTVSGKRYYLFLQITDIIAETAFIRIFK